MAPCTIILVWLCLFVGLIEQGLALNVSYDHRGLILDGQHRLLISGSIHYPRATPEMWPDLLANAKAGGLDVIETYVFWDGHEPSKGQYNFEGRYNLVQFIKLIQQAGLYCNLRIGPYACAEWNFGGFPVWLLDISGIHFRTNNEPFKEEMQGFVEKIVGMMKSESLFAPQGGPIILAQIENEYGGNYKYDGGTVEEGYGSAGKDYMKWAANMAVGLNIGIPWIMCKQSDAPSYIIDTCNGFYCDDWNPNAYNKPKMWTENWSGWYQKWGQATPARPVEDVAFAVARFFERGGSFQNYYMYFGGTNFERTSGGPYVTTSYDYDAPIDEYGQIRQPKWGHLRDLHKSLKLCELALGSNNPRKISFGSNLEAHVYGKIGSSMCAAFLANIHTTANGTVHFNNQTYFLPAWSVSILPDCSQAVFNTAKVNQQTTIMAVELHSVLSSHRQRSFNREIVSGLDWEALDEPVGALRGNFIRASGLIEHLKATKDTTDYLWYITSVQVSEASSALLTIESMRDVLYIYVNGILAGSANAISSSTMYTQVNQPIKLNAGTNTLALLCTTVGLQNYGKGFETWGAGINGSVFLRGLLSGDMNLTSREWTHQVGLMGEKQSLFTDEGSASMSWKLLSISRNQSLVWYKARFDAPPGSDPVSIDLGSMGKGQAWVNGQSIGRFWPSILAPQTGCQSCDYRGTYNSSKCRTGCGQPSQQLYHVPRAWLKDTGNLVVLLEEVGGDPSGISIGTRPLNPSFSHVSNSYRNLVSCISTCICFLVICAFMHVH